jgi:hypothetical protein
VVRVGPSLACAAFLAVVPSAAVLWQAAQEGALLTPLVPGLCLGFLAVSALTYALVSWWERRWRARMRLRTALRVVMAVWLVLFLTLGASTLAVYLALFHQ